MAFDQFKNKKLLMNLVDEMLYYFPVICWNVSAKLSLHYHSFLSKVFNIYITFNKPSEDVQKHGYGLLGKAASGLHNILVKKMHKATQRGFVSVSGN